jgi:hypothetical protein
MNRTKQALEHYKQIMNGVIPWYNFKDRLGCWYEFNDGLDEISAIEKYFVEIEDFERASDMKEQYGILKEYMIEENIFDKGVLDEYK